MAKGDEQERDLPSSRQDEAEQPQSAEEHEFPEGGPMIFLPDLEPRALARKQFLDWMTKKPGHE